MPPGEGTAVEWVLKALHPRLVPIIHRGGAGERKQQGGSQLQEFLPPTALIRIHSEAGAPLPGAVPALVPHAQQGEDTWGVVGSQGIHGGVEGKPGVVLPQGLHRLHKVPGVSAPEVGQGRAAEGVVHQPVAVPPQDMAAAHAVGYLGGAVLPHLANDHRVRLLRPGCGVDPLDKVIRQFIRHIQPPAVSPRPQPPADYRVLSAKDKLPIGWVVLVHCGQGVDPPPTLISIWPLLEIVPGGPG